MFSAPHEIAFGDVFLPPLLLVIAIAYACALLTARGLAGIGLHRVIAAPALFELSLTAIYTVLIGTFIIPS
ncbi:DUF1656 domain-containing protein [Ferrimonas gelatinilytica]|uniref:DUF1656 domain-containing protein n=1 Tax=Ferrimonas gelatinilytica TaxID=1255257 RepID=A0ABP9S8B8_9GAMM